MKKLIFVLFFFILAISFSLNAQQKPVGYCGTTVEDQYFIKERMLANREYFKNQPLPRPEAITYIPIRYFLVAKDDGTGRITDEKVYENLCGINKIYITQNLSFYLKEIKYINNTSMWENGSASLSAQRINQFNLQNKNAVNVFCVNVANGSELGVLAFYNRVNDYIVCGNPHVIPNGTTLAHEIGHYFSLNHTFYGWENDDYNTITMNCTKTTPMSTSTGILVEYVDRNKTVGTQKQCYLSADGFCDTPADYNLGFGWNGCTYSGCAKDPDEVKLNPDEKNIMSYFLDCLEYFSEEQKDAILKDLNSAKRNFLRSSVYTPKLDLAGSVNYISPKIGEIVAGYNEVKFEWAAVPDAEFYFVTIGGNPTFTLYPQSFKTARTDTVITNLRKSSSIYWKVYPVNANSFCMKGATVNFKTPAFGVATNEVLKNKISISNIVQSGSDVEFIINSDYPDNIQIQLQNSIGQNLNSIKYQIEAGSQSISIPNCIPGIYTYNIDNKNSRLKSGKIVLY